VVLGRLRRDTGDAEAPAQPPGGEDGWDFDWPEPEPEDAPPYRPGRRAIALGALAAVVLAGAGLAALVGRDPERTQSEQRQLEAVAPGASKQRRPSLAVSPTVRRAAARLSLPQQVQQLMLVDLQGQYPRDPFFARQRRRAWGGVVLGTANFVDEDQFSLLTGEVNVVARQARQVRPLIAISQSGGAGSVFPDLPPRAQPDVGDTGRPALARSEARAAARALRARGVNMALAPNADVGSAVGPYNDLVFGSDPQRVARMVSAAVAGWRSGRVVAAVGHFPGAGAASGDPSSTNATVGLSRAELRTRDLPPFRAVARTAPVIVISNAVYAAFDGISPAVVLPEVMGGLLRRELGFRGVVMADDLNSTAPVQGVGVGTAAVGAVQAGADLLYVSGGEHEQELVQRALLRAVRSGRLTRERINLSVQRLLALKERYGLLPRPARRRPARRPGPAGR